jgi:hypothetical protein
LDEFADADRVDGSDPNQTLDFAAQTLQSVFHLLVTAEDIAAVIGVKLPGRGDV